MLAIGTVRSLQVVEDRFGYNPAIMKMASARVGCSILILLVAVAASPQDAAVPVRSALEPARAGGVEGAPGEREERP